MRWASHRSIPRVGTATTSGAKGSAGACASSARSPATRPSARSERWMWSMATGSSASPRAGSKRRRHPMGRAGAPTSDSCDRAVAGARRLRRPRGRDRPDLRRLALLLDDRDERALGPTLADDGALAEDPDAADVVVAVAVLADVAGDADLHPRARGGAVGRGLLEADEPGDDDGRRARRTRARRRGRGRGRRLVARRRAATGGETGRRGGCAEEETCCAAMHA